MSQQTIPSFPAVLGQKRWQRTTRVPIHMGHRAHTFNLLLAIAVGLHILFDGTYIIQGLAYSNLIKLSFLGLLLILALRDGGPLGRPATAIVLVYGLLSLQSMLVVPVSENLGSSLWGAEKYLYRSFLTFWALSRCLGSRLVSINTVMNTWLGMALYFSVTGILVFILMQLLGFSLPTVTLALDRIGEEKSMLIGLGFADGLPRIQSFFSEANKFAQFLILPIYLLMAMSPTRRNRLFLLVIGLAFVLTFSVAGAGGFLFGLVLWASLMATTRAKRWAVLIGGTIVLALSFYFIAESIWAPYQFQSQDNLYYRTVVHKYGSLEATLANIRYGLQLANEHPLGIGMISTADTEVYGFGSDDILYNTASGIGKVLGRSGWPGIFLHGMMFLMAWRTLAWYASEVRSGNADSKGLALGISYFALVVAATNFGAYDQRTIVVSLALFLAFVHRHKVSRQLD